MRIFLTLLLLLSWPYLYAQQHQEINSDPVQLLAELRKIHTPNGIEITEQIELNGAQQWINIRGKDMANPVLLVIHGGPASPLMPLSWAFQNGWEDFFTVVHWDQRTAGKNWLQTDTSLVADQLRFQTLIRDAYFLVEYLRERLQKEKIFLMGYSYGAGIGIRMAARIPEKLHAYIGVGQMAPGEPEKVIYETLLRLAEDAQENKALEELHAIAPYPNPDGRNPIQKLQLVRKWARHFDGGWYGKKDFDLLFSLPSLSPDYTLEEIQSLDVSTPWITRKIVAQGGGGDFPKTFTIPIVFMMGKHDLHTPFASAYAYWNSLEATQKTFISFDYSGHVPFLEEPGKFLLELVTMVHPLAEKGK